MIDELVGLPGKTSVWAEAGTVISIRTPGGGGHGEPVDGGTDSGNDRREAEKATDD